VSTEAIFGGRDGGQPSVPASGDGFSWEGEDAWAARLAAETDADAAWIDEESVAAALSVLASAGGLGGHDLGGLAQGGLLDLMAPEPGLAAVAAGACDPAVLAALSDDQVLGLAAAGRRLAGRAAWIQQAAIAEFAARRAEPDPEKATPLGFTPFAPDELAPELVITGAAAEERMARAADASRRLPACSALLRDGLVGEYQLKIITDATVALSDAGAAEADTLLAAAAAAAGLTPGQLRAMCARTVLMIDPAAAQRRKERAARDARVERFQEYSGNAALCGRELPPEAVLAASAHIDACARGLRAAGIPGTLQQLRVAAYLDLTQGLDPLARLTEAAADAAGQPDGGAAADRDDDARPEADDPDDGQDGGRGPGGGAGPGPGGPSGPSGTSARDKPPVKAVITLLVPAGTLLGWSSAPGEIAGFGLLDPQATRDLTAAASHHPETRWCVTVVGPDGTAAAHGCAPGRHPWTPGQHHADPNRHRTGGGERPGPGPPADNPGAAEQAAQVTTLLRRLRVRLAPIATGHCDHRHHSDKYVISRTVRHLIKARTATCPAPGCRRPAADADADHTIPWPAGPSCECNLGPPCRYHHRCKQAPGWHLDQPQPGVMKWRNPSGRTHTTHPTRYTI
jgi:hypothetical protein